MPLFMDIHKFSDITVEDVKKAHLADESIQDQYGVKFHQFWVNEAAGTVFCLVEGPDMETCQLVHQTSHGNIPCNMVEVETGYFKLLMGDGLPVNEGLVMDYQGLADPGYRHLMVLNIRANTNITRSEDYKYLEIPLKPKNLVLDRMIRFKGRLIEKPGHDQLIGVFNTAINALRCAKDIQHEFQLRKRHNPKDPEWKVILGIGLSTGEPLTEHKGFFDEALALAGRLCIIAQEDAIVASALLKEICEMEGGSSVKVLNKSEEDFLTRLFEIVEAHLPDHDFNVDSLCRKIGISRPQLYRKIRSLSGSSPNDFIQFLRMNRALSLLKHNSGNISEIALEVGYNNPSYFSKCFLKNYGCTPSRFMKTTAAH